MSDRPKEAESFQQAVCDSEILILPIPMCKKELLNLSSEHRITVVQLLEYLQPGQRVYGGVIPEEFKRSAKEKGVVCYDYMKEETIAIYNSIATAEGTIAEILRTCPFNLHGRDVLVLGYGICARTLVKKLQALECSVCVCARRQEAVMEAYAAGAKTLSLKHLAHEIHKYPIIVNTIPARILDSDKLALINGSSRIYEIASYPYCMDIKEAEARGIKVEICGSLPAKYSPLSSARILKEYILETLGQKNLTQNHKMLEERKV